MASVHDLAELGRLWQEYSPRLLAMLERRIGEGQRRRYGPEDVLSEAFLIARGKWAGFLESGKMTPWAWLYRLALDALYDRWRREHREGRDERRDMPFPDRSSAQLGLKILCPGTKPSEAFARQELCDRVHQALGLLSEPQRQVLWMRYFDGLSTAEIAAVLDQTADAVYQHHHRAMKQLTRLWRTLNPGSEAP
ncbi:MAG: RNA polymerase sigma factor [Gemmataceae bacterium]